MGGLVSYIFSGFSTKDILIYSDHYIKLLFNTLAILPITIAFVSAIPIREFENNLLQECKGVSSFEKKMLISSRIFNHIIYIVIPKLLQIKKEENNLNEITFEDFIEDSFLSNLSNISLLIKKKIQEFINLLIILVVESLEFIPLWSIEINELPNNKLLNHERGRKKKNK